MPRNASPSMMLLSMIALGCDGPERMVAAHPDPAATFGGPVLRATVTEGGGREALIQTAPSGANSGRVWVAVYPGTAVRFRSGRVGLPSDVREGQVLSVWASGALLKSDPARTAADSVIIER